MDCTLNTKRLQQLLEPLEFFNLGIDLFSHSVTRAVSSALEGLTAVFGMGTGVSPPLWTPRLKGLRSHLLGRSVPSQEVFDNWDWESSEVRPLGKPSVN